MVITRRSPAAPSSRTPSSQAVPRTPSAAALRQRKDAATPRNGEANGDADDAAGGSKKFRRVQPKKKHKKKKPASLTDVLFRWLLLFFTIYTAAVCPSDHAQQSAVCRGLSEYRKLVLEPYLLPQLHRAFAHPSVAPYVARAQPYTDRALVLATDARRTVIARAVPLWHDRVWPALEPHYTAYLSPHIHTARAYLEPRIERAYALYGAHVEPYINRFIALILRAAQAAAPYVSRALYTSHAAYIRAQPYLAAATVQARHITERVAHEAAVQRRTFVDPHIAKIWARVKELSKGVPPPPPHIVDTPEVAKTATTTSEDAAYVTPVVEVPREGGQAIFNVQDKASVHTSNVAETEPTRPAEEAAPTPSDEPVPAQVQDTASVAHATEVAEPEPVLESATPAADLAAETVTSATASITDASTVDASAVDVAVETPTDGAITVTDASTTAVVATFGTASPLDDTPASLASPSSAAQVSVPPPVATKAAKPSSDIDLDAFYAELGLADTDIVADEAAETLVAPPPEEPLSPEEIAALEAKKKAEIAAKRAEIEAKHTRWEEQLDALARESKKRLRKTLVALRKPAAAVLRADESIKAQIELLVREGERFLAGAEAYMKNLRKEERDASDKAGLWSRVLGRVDDKFTERLKETEAVVNTWYSEHLAREEAEVTVIAQEVRDAADAAQADVGLDYVWLEDVSYLDWQRYHELLNRAATFKSDAETIQNGTHPSPPANAVLTVIVELENEVQDIVLGFETRIRQLRRVGVRAFGKAARGAEDDEDGEDADADEGIDAEEEALLRDPDVIAILPVPDEEPLQQDTLPIVGRGKKEVEDAFARAEGAPPVVKEDTAAAEGISRHEEL